MSNIIIVTGATASGKSAYAVNLAQEIDGVVINADAMQLYVDAPILTAQPTAIEQMQAPHALYGTLKTDDVCNAVRYVELAGEHIHAAWAVGQTPILTGGTGLYLRAICEGMVAIPEIDASVRAEVRALPVHDLRAQLQAEDAEIAVILHDAQRMARALEVIKCTGKSLLWWQSQPNIPPFPEAHFRVIISELPRPQLYERINARYANMVENGGLEEAKQLLASGYNDDLPLMRAVGVRQLLCHLRGEYDYAQAISVGQVASRQYAKRQLTWLRNQDNFPVASQ